jgi:UDP-N-acetylmuramate--alanine ligase
MYPAMQEKEMIHFIGIGGAGMSGIARILLELGYEVSGSDLCTSETTRRLELLGARVFLGHHADHVNEDHATVVISSAIPEENPEVIKAKELGIPVLQRAEMLSRLMERQHGIAIAGAHGKTTTSSIISLLFEKNGYDPTIVLGGELNDIGGNAKLGRGKYIIAEADESDGSFLKLFPQITVVTNIEDDHLDHYGTKENISAAFYQFLLQTSADGFAVLCADDPGVKELLPKLEGKMRILKYGLDPGAENDAGYDYLAREVRLNRLETRFLAERAGEVLGEIKLSVPGRHNVSNALAAVAVAMECGLSFAQIAASIAEFRGVHRRFEKIGEVDGVHIVDDYAHHPSELKATLQAARTVQPKRIVAVFQPHRYTRTKNLQTEFGTAFREADVLIMTGIYPAGEKPIEGVGTELIIDEIVKQTGQKVEYIPEREMLASRLVEIVQPGDLVLTLGAGNICSTGMELKRLLEQRTMKVC